MSTPATLEETTKTAPVDILRLPQIAATRSPSIFRDILTLFVIPALLMTVLFLTFDPEAFEYVIAEPTLWGIYGSNLAHRSWMHLGSNLVGFFLIGGLEYFLLTASGYRRHYLAAFALVVLIAPLFSHLFLQFVLVHQPLFHSYEAVGFSESIAALTAYFPLALVAYYNRVSRLQWPILTALLLYSGGVGLAIAQIFGLEVSTLFIGAFGISGVVIIFTHLYRKDTLSTQQRREYMATSLFALCVFAAALYSLFPGSNIGTMVGHFAGYLPGFFLPLSLIWGVTKVIPAHKFSLNLRE